MAVVDVTVDNVIRRVLAMKGVPIHYYLPMLIIAKRGLEEMHFDTLQKMSYVQLTLPTSGDKIVNLPSDYVEYVDIAFEVGDKIKSIGRNEHLNRRDNSGAAFDVVVAQQTPATSYNIPALWLPNFYNEYGTNKGRMFGSNLTWEKSFTVNRELGFIRVDNNFTVSTKLHMIYLTLPQKISGQSVIHPFAQNALIDYCLWKWEQYTGGPMTAVLRHEYFESYRKLRARLSKASVTEFVRSLRRHNNLAIK